MQRSSYFVYLSPLCGLGVQLEHLVEMNQKRSGCAMPESGAVTLLVVKSTSLDTLLPLHVRLSYVMRRMLHWEERSTRADSSSFGVKV